MAKRKKRSQSAGKQLLQNALLAILLILLMPVAVRLAYTATGQADAPNQPESVIFDILFDEAELAQQPIVEIDESSQQATPGVVRSSGVCVKGTSTCFPEVGSLYTCPNTNAKLRKTIGTGSGSLNIYQEHGNVHYYNRGIVSWFGQDFISGCLGDKSVASPKTVLAPISGIMQGDTDGAGVNGSGYACTIYGRGEYQGFFLRILHLKGQCTQSGQTVSVQKGQPIGKETNHIHVILQFGAGTYSIKGKDVPITLLMPKNVKIGQYQAGKYIEGGTPANSTFGWMDIKQ